MHVGKRQTKQKRVLVRDDNTMDVLDPPDVPPSGGETRLGTGRGHVSRPTLALVGQTGRRGSELSEVMKRNAGPGMAIFR